MLEDSSSGGASENAAMQAAGMQDPAPFTPPPKSKRVYLTEKELVPVFPKGYKVFRIDTVEANLGNYFLGVTEPDVSADQKSNGSVVYWFDIALMKVKRWDYRKMRWVIDEGAPKFAANLKTEELVGALEIEEEEEAPRSIKSLLSEEI